MEFGIDYEEWGTKFLDRMRNENKLDLSGRREYSEWMCR